MWSQAHKAALITHGLASAWRSVPAKDPTPLDPDLGRGPSTPSDQIGDGLRSLAAGDAASRRSSVHEGDAPLALPPTFELWVFGTGGQLAALGEDAAFPPIHDEFPTTPASDALHLLGDCLLLLSAAFTNRAERLLLAGGFVRLGDNLVPRGDKCAAHAPPMLPALQLECFLRDAELMALIFVKLVRVQVRSYYAFVPGCFRCGTACGVGHTVWGVGHTRFGAVLRLSVFGLTNLASVGSLERKRRRVFVRTPSLSTCAFSVISSEAELEFTCPTENILHSGSSSFSSLFLAFLKGP